MGTGVVDGVKAPSTLKRASGRYCCGDLVERRIGNFVSRNLQSAFDELSQVFHNFWIAGRGVGVGILLLIPQANPNSFRPAWSEERKFALKAFLLSKRRNCFVLDLLRERDRAVGLQKNRYMTSKHVNLLGCGLAKRERENVRSPDLGQMI